MKTGTKCVQGGYAPKSGEPRQIPIIQSTTFKYDTSEAMGKLFDLEAEGYFYTRLQNPTNDAVAAKICALEGGSAAMLTSSGQAASFYSVFNIASCGDHVVASATIYGGTYNLFAVTMKRMGVEFTFVSPDCTEEELDAAFRPNTKAVFGETIANPALTVLDIEKFAAAAHRHGVPLIVDNTFATPINCRPFEWGADIVTHSNGRQLMGVANVLSTMSGTPWRCAAAANFSMSSTVSAGFAMVSPNTALVFGRNAASSSSSVQSGETNVNSTPIRFIVTAKRLYVPP